MGSGVSLNDWFGSLCCTYHSSGSFIIKHLLLNFMSYILWLKIKIKPITWSEYICKVNHMKGHVIIPSCWRYVQRIGEIKLDGQNRIVKWCYIPSQIQLSAVGVINWGNENVYESWVKFEIWIGKIGFHVFWKSHFH